MTEHITRSIPLAHVQTILPVHAYIQQMEEGRVSTTLSISVDD